MGERLSYSMQSCRNGRQHLRQEIPCNLAFLATGGCQSWGIYWFCCKKKPFLPRRLWRNSSGVAFGGTWSSSGAMCVISCAQSHWERGNERMENMGNKKKWSKEKVVKKNNCPREDKLRTNFWGWGPEPDPNAIIHFVQNDSKYCFNDVILHCGNTTMQPRVKYVLRWQTSRRFAVFWVDLRPRRGNWRRLQVKEQSCSDRFVDRWFKRAVCCGEGCNDLWKTGVRAPFSGKNLEIYVATAICRLFFKKYYFGKQIDLINISSQRTIK